jgi:hypothetical protein
VSRCPEYGSPTQAELSAARANEATLTRRVESVEAEAEAERVRLVERTTHLEAELVRQAAGSDLHVKVNRPPQCALQCLRASPPAAAVEPPSCWPLPSAVRLATRVVTPDPTRDPPSSLVRVNNTERTLTSFENSDRRRCPSSRRWGRGWRSTRRRCSGRCRARCVLTLSRCMLTLPRYMLTLPRCMLTLPRCMLTLPRGVLPYPGVC